MAYYKKQKLNGKWYPRSVTVGTLTTADVAERLSRMSTVTRGDVYAVLQQMRVQHDGEAVLAQTVLTHKLRKILHAENVKPAPDCGDLIELLFDQTSGQELEGF